MQVYEPDLQRLVDEAEARQLPALIAEWADAPDDRRWIARALRLDLPVLVERPELAFPSVYRRCAHLGGEAERWCYEPRAPLPDVSSLRALVERWAQHWDRAWLRSRRPLAHPLDAPIVEEYRTSLPGIIRFSPDAALVGVVSDGNEVVAWERATGRRYPATPAQLMPAPSTWACGESTPGRCVLVRGGRRVAIELPTPRIAYAAHDAGAGILLVEAGADDLQELTYVVDVERERVLWLIDVDRICERGVVLDDRRIVIVQGRSFEIRDLATGEVLESLLSAHYRTEADTLERSLASDGSMALRSGNVIRIWDPRGLPSSTQRRGTGGQVLAFTEDSTRLLAGSLLCDARSGAVIARLSDGALGGWMHRDGPAAGCQRLCRDLFVEIRHLSSRAWHVRDGSIAFENLLPRAASPERVRIDLSGRYAAIARTNKLEIWALREATLLAEHPASLVEDPYVEPFGFSPDGQLAWWLLANGGRRFVMLHSPRDVLSFAPGEPIPVEPKSERLRVTGGVLVAGDTALPCDDGTLVGSPDGRAFAQLEHVTLE